MDKIFRTIKLFRSKNELLSPPWKNPKFLTPILLFHGSNKILASDPDSEFDFDNIKLRSAKPISKKTQISEEQFDPNRTAKAREMKGPIDPWPEWLDFIDFLSKKGYFERDRVQSPNADLEVKEFNHIRTACLNFARDRSNLISYLSRKELHMIAGCGCPSTDRKVVNSGKRLRAHMSIDEGNICSSCNLRGECERAFVKASGDEGGRTVDIIRILLFYRLNQISTAAENWSYLNKKANNAVRRLLKEIVEYSSEEHESNMPKSNGATSAEYLPDPQENHDANASMKAGDWLCSKCNFLNFSRNMKCLRCGSLFLERLRKLHEDQVDLPLKKGDWICDKCNFLNFAKNSRCLQCLEKPSNRLLNPGEWECESCNYINFRRNMLCLKCDHRRPKAQTTSKISAGSVVANGSYSFCKPSFASGETGSTNRRASSRKVDASMWRFVEQDGGDHADFGDSRFLDFPIAGGIGGRESSRNAERRERWELETLESRKSRVDATEKEDDLILRSNHIERRIELNERSDDEDMAEWFGIHKAISEK